MNTSFQKTKGHDEWLTPKWLIHELGHFDLDPCSPINRPWDTADKHYNINDDGYNQPWNGFVFCNPPYGSETWKWLEKLSNHKGGGIALIFSRTDTIGFQKHVFQKADSLLFIKGRLKFCFVDGTEGGPAGCGSVLVAYGNEAKKRLEKLSHIGKIVNLT